MHFVHYKVHAKSSTRKIKSKVHYGNTLVQFDSFDRLCILHKLSVHTFLSLDNLDVNDSQFYVHISILSFFSKWT